MWKARPGRVTADVQKRAKLPGFRPGKAPTSIIRKQFAGDIRQQVLESLIPKFLQKQFEAENLNVVGTPDITDVHFHDGEPLSFKAEFEVVPEIELGDYRGVEVPYHDPDVTEEDIDKRIEELREQKAQYVNVDPRPVEDGDYAVVALESLAGVEGEPVKKDEMVLEIGGADTFAAFTENLRGLTPGDEKEFEVAYPEDYGSKRLAGNTVKFHATSEGDSPQGTAGGERRVRAGSGRLPRHGRTARGHPQEHLRAARSTRPSRKPRTRSSTSWWTRTISRCPKSSSSGRSRTAWSRACAPWPARAWIRGRSSWIGRR